MGTNKFSFVLKKILFVFANLKGTILKIIYSYNILTIGITGNTRKWYTGPGSNWRLSACKADATTAVLPVQRAEGEGFEPTDPL